MTGGGGQGTGSASVDWRRVLRMVGLGARGSMVLVGVERVREGVRRDRVHLALVAPDASRHSREKVVPMLEARRVFYIEGPTAAELGTAVGRESTAVVGIVDRELARGIRALLAVSPGSAH